MSEIKVNLPKTKLAMKANLPNKEPDILKYWDTINLYELQKQTFSKREKFILHDGPPYANGDIHIGTALNKVLKDIVVKFQSVGLQKYSPYVPGWDCHGLPIEWKIEELNKKKGVDKTKLSVNEFRGQCRDFASKWIDIQKNQFKRLGVIGDWENYYSTMSNEAEAIIAKEILKFLKNGGLYKGYKPVLWSVVEKTALADAEVEYKDKVSNTIYAKFKINKKFKNHDNISVVIWTTTPWTIPCNRALCYNSKYNYTILNISHNNIEEKVIVATDLIDNFIKENDIKKYKKIETFIGSEFNNTKCIHPFKEYGYDFEVPMLDGEYVTLEQGTGIVHIAPSHGPDDFHLSLKNKILVENTLEDDGTYTDKIKKFKGVHIYKADKIVIDELKKTSSLISAGEYKHSYPHSWRSKAPLVHRATPQWFISMEKNNLRSSALKAIGKTSFYPEIGKNRLEGMIESRPDWCISRQRFWGVPLPIFVNKKTEKPLVDEKVFDNIFNIFKSQGSDSWFKLPAQEFLTNKYKSEDYHQVKDIVEVWFDSGSSHTYVLEERKNLNWPADMYLEGSDQHRGWFHSSLLQSCGTRGEAPYKNILTHGFVVDGKGQKMSKSLGNVVSPDEIIKKYGADILRLWVVASDYSEDLRLDNSIINHHAESYRKIRYTFRFILGNLNDQLNLDEIKNTKLNKNFDEFDTYILCLISKLDKQFTELSKQFAFHKIYIEVLNFCINDLSAFYFDIKKDSLYCDAVESDKRKNTILILKHIFYFLLKWLSPILAFTTEEIFGLIKKPDEKSIFLVNFNSLDQLVDLKAYNEEKWDYLKKVKSEVNNEIEIMRNNKTIGSSLETQIEFTIENEVKKYFEKINLSDFFITSDAKIALNDQSFDKVIENKNVKGLKIIINKAVGIKCIRCWKYFVNDKSVDKKLCKRCESVQNAI